MGTAFYAKRNESWGKTSGSSEKPYNWKQIEKLINYTNIEHIFKIQKFYKDFLFNELWWSRWSIVVYNDVHAKNALNSDKLNANNP